MRTANRTILFFLFALTLVVAGAGSTARAQGACCTFDDCLPAADDLECNGLNGVFLDGEDCATDPCAPAACCHGLNCATAGAYSCITAGREYAGAGTTCLDDPCGADVGACCLDGACSDISPDDCNSSGGTWLGAGTNCTQGLCDLGSCCLPGVCNNEALFVCNAAGGTFSLGGDCISDPDACAVEGDCALNSLYSQSPDNVNAFTGYTSESGAGLQRWDNYSGAVGPIDSLAWWGFAGELVGSTFTECIETDPTFQISFHQDEAGLPGAAVCSYTLAATVTPTGIDYAGFELNEYGVSLPTPCILIDGWVSVVGQGDPACWFLWLSSPDGDQFSYCDNCQVPEEQDDLSFCIGGTRGGVFGACCDQSTGGCTDSVEIQDCAATGQRFTDDTLCADLDPPCTPASGGCCFGDGTCYEDDPGDCIAAGGDWLGEDVGCEFCPQPGACCFDQFTCSLETEAVCDAQGFTFVGAGTTCDQCPATPECPVDSLFAQSPDDPSDFEAGTSEESRGLRRFEDFSAVAGAIDSLSWWGVDLELVGNDWIECVEPFTAFSVSFHDDAGGVPGPAVCSYQLNSSYTPTGIRYLGAELNEYGVTLPTPCVLTHGWVSIVGRGDPDCWFLWMSSDLFGDSWCDNCIPSAQEFDLNTCFRGTVGGVFGACCDDPSAVCNDAVEITACLGTDQRFVRDQACSALDPPCGTILGACCMDDATCAIEESVDCTGDWLGADTLCDQCPCVTPCPPGGTPEGELPCTDDYVDTFNGGCTAASPAFSQIALGETVCGESGMFFTGGPDPQPDYDWYELTVAAPTEIVWSAQAEFPPRLWIFDASSGCPATALASNSVLECEPLAISAEVDPGTYWLVVHPNAFTDSSTCPSAYTATVTGTPLGLKLVVAPGTISWTAQPGTVRYDLVRGDLGKLRGSAGDFTFSTEECLANNILDTFWDYPADPGDGEGFWFLVRVVEFAGNGSYDSDGVGQVGLRDAEIDASPQACP